MKPVMQTKFGGEGAAAADQGNCVAARLASVLEIPLEAVPDFLVEYGHLDWQTGLNDWLAQFNLCLIVVPRGKAAGMWGYAMMGTKSPRLEGGHLVVVHGGHGGHGVVHDPHPAGDVDGHGEPEEMWFLVVRDPSKLVPRSYQTNLPAKRRGSPSDSVP